MLAEIRHALVDAAEGYRHDGVGAREAELLAVLEFGSAPRIAAGLQDVLAVMHGRRTALLLLVVLGAQHGMSELLGRIGSWQQLWGGVEPGAAYLWLARATDAFAGLALAAAVAAVIFLRWGLRQFGIRLAVVRLTAVLASVVVGTTMVCGALLTVLPPGAGGAEMVAGGLGWTASSALVLASARHCWRAAADRPDLRPAEHLVGS